MIKFVFQKDNSWDQMEDTGIGTGKDSKNRELGTGWIKWSGKRKWGTNKGSGNGYHLFDLCRFLNWQGLVTHWTWDVKRGEKVLGKGEVPSWSTWVNVMPLIWMGVVKEVLPCFCVFEFVESRALRPFVYPLSLTPGPSRR